MMFRRVIGNRCASLSRWFPVILQDSMPCLGVTPNKIRNICQQNRIQQLSQNVRSLSTSGFLTQQPSKKDAVTGRHYCTSGSSDNDKGFLVYEGRVKKLFWKVKVFSLTTSVIGLACQPYLWYTVQDLSLLIAAPLFTAVNFFVFANPIMIHYLAKRYVNELYYNPQTQTFTATVLSFFARQKSFDFTSNDVVVPEIPGLFAMLTAKGQPLFVDHRDFTSIEVYKHMMGFDKPLDVTYVAKSSEKKD